MPDEKASAATPNPAVSGIVSLMILIAGGWYFFGGGLEKHSESKVNEIQQTVATDFEKQYQIAKRNGSAMDACVQAGLVAAGHLQAKNESAYKRWKKVESVDCAKAGVPR